eukprot:TRINITY_DN14636_c0_g3_i1.p1 TRINITY_DN14636_c0_g3~~TRINITY_DN14636_c0_g3_i1.p1  ORF type:complete len:497 (+),score=35.51 TRINITY_DN14636_c0_g3_i1:64-1491(+)
MVTFDRVVPVSMTMSEGSVSPRTDRWNFVTSLARRPDDIVVAQLINTSRTAMTLLFCGLVFSCVFTFIFAALLSSRIPRTTSVVGAGLLRNDWSPSITCQEWVGLTTCATRELETPLGSPHDQHILFITEPLRVLSVGLSCMILLKALFAEVNGVSPFLLLLPLVTAGIYVVAWAYHPVNEKAKHAVGILMLILPILVAVANHLKAPEEQIVRCLKGKVMGLVGLIMNSFGAYIFVNVMVRLGNSSANAAVVIFAADLLEGALGAVAMWFLYRPSLERVPCGAKLFLVFSFDVLCEQALKDHITGLGKTKDVLLGNFGKTLAFLLRKLALPLVLMRFYREHQKRVMLLTSVVTSMSAEIVTLVISALRVTCFEPAYFDLSAPTQPAAVDGILLSLGIQLAFVVSSNVLVLYYSVHFWRHVDGGSDAAAFSQSFYTMAWVTVYMFAKCLTIVSMIGLKFRRDCTRCDESLSRCFVC